MQTEIFTKGRWEGWAEMGMEFTRDSMVKRLKVCLKMACWFHKSNDISIVKYDNWEGWFEIKLNSVSSLRMKFGWYKFLPVFTHNTGHLILEELKIRLTGVFSIVGL